MRQNLKDKINGFTRKCQVNNVEYKISEGCEKSIFASCFALFLKDLFGEIKGMPLDKKTEWANYINSFQDKKFGYYTHKDKNTISEKSIYQLTTFCLSALEILEASPKYELKFLSNFNSKESIYEYLNDKGSLTGLPGSGNYAMAIAIFLTYKQKITKSQEYTNLIQYWFDLHDKAQNPKTGFWGKKILERHYWGFQNALHQFLIYHYHSRPIGYPIKIANRIISMQDHNGFFSMYPGGGGCWDFDAAHTLISLDINDDNVNTKIMKSLIRLKNSLINSINVDGGFCESKMLPNRWTHLPSFLKFIVISNNPYIAYSKIKTTIPLIKNRKIFNHWSEDSYSFENSDLWNTFLKTLTIAEIETYQNRGRINVTENTIWNFQRFVGFGYLKI